MPPCCIAPIKVLISPTLLYRNHHTATLINQQKSVYKSSSPLYTALPSEITVIETLCEKRIEEKNRMIAAEFAINFNGHSYFSIRVRAIITGFSLLRSYAFAATLPELLYGAGAFSRSISIATAVVVKSSRCFCRGEGERILKCERVYSVTVYICGGGKKLTSGEQLYV